MEAPSLTFHNKFIKKMEHIQEKIKDDLDDEVRSAFSVFLSKKTTFVQNYL